ncbi:hypothetical protein BDR07DRAFT_1580454, partial [Suillus spraguei]
MTKPYSVGLIQNHRSLQKRLPRYQDNNEKTDPQITPPLDAMTIPCITMVGTRPIFYLVPVTEALRNAVA